ncbi:hypothetical protein LNP05_10535 [Klebsiella pneumoniae subsp. pneumoniae]|nr:hypothetical protein [Klebsiella pneumoniae subsp. pneumoniae]
MLHPAVARRLDRQRLREFDDNFAPAIQHHRFGVGGAFIQGNDELFCCRLHRALLGHSVSWNREDEEYLPPSPASVQAML